MGGDPQTNCYVSSLISILLPLTVALPLGGLPPEALTGCRGGKGLSLVTLGTCWWLNNMVCIKGIFLVIFNLIRTDNNSVNTYNRSLFGYFQKYNFKCWHKTGAIKLLTDPFCAVICCNIIKSCHEWLKSKPIYFCLISILVLFPMEMSIHHSNKIWGKYLFLYIKKKEIHTFV